MIISEIEQLRKKSKATQLIRERVWIDLITVPDVLGNTQNET
jgi:hypothetical protein